MKKKRKTEARGSGGPLNSERKHAFRILNECFEGGPVPRNSTRAIERAIQVPWIAKRAQEVYTFTNKIHPDHGAIAGRMDVLKRCAGARWAENAYATFDLDEDTASALMLTDNASAEEISLPFSAFMIRLPQKIYQMEDESHAEHLSVSLWDRDDGKCELLLCVLTVSEKEGDRLYPEMVLADTDSPSAIAEAFKNMNISRDLQALANVDPVLNERRGSMKRLAANLCILIEDIGMGKLEPMRKLLSGTTGTVPHVRRWLVGSPVKLSHATKMAARRFANPSFKMDHRSITRGHYKMQPYGPKNSLRKRLWISPYIRGPKEGELIDRTYKV